MIMLKLNPTYNLFLWALCIAFHFLFSANAHGQKVSETRTITKVSGINSFTTLDISNKYGTIEIIPWEKDSVKFSISVFLEAKDRKRLQELKDNINIDFGLTDYFLSATTRFSNDKNFFSDFLKLNETFSSKENQVKINYTVYAPSYLALKIMNKFGDVIIDELKGNLNLNLANGNLKANHLSAGSEIELSFCNTATINDINIAKLKLSYSEVEIKKAEQLTIDSKSTRLTIGEVNIIKTESKRDKYQIAKINHLYGNTYFSVINIQELIAETNIEVKYGEINLESVANNFSLINFSSKYADITISTNKIADFYLEINEKNANVDVPKNFIKLKEDMTQGYKTISGRVSNSTQYASAKLQNNASGNYQNRKVIIRSEGGSNKIISK